MQLSDAGRTRLAERDKRVLSLLIAAYGQELRIGDESTEKIATTLRRYSLLAGRRVAKLVIRDILTGVPPAKSGRLAKTYDGLTRVFAAIEPRLITDGSKKRNCFEMPDEELKLITERHKSKSLAPNELTTKFDKIRDVYGVDHDNEEPADRELEVARGQRGKYAEAIFANFTKNTKRGDEPIDSGLFQVFRRYKPERKKNDQPSRVYDWTDPKNQALIIELLYIDSDALECVLITGEGDKYIGALNINSKGVVFAILQRWQASEVRLKHRMLSVALADRQLPFYSGLAIKIGDTTGRPIASECMFVRVSQTDHKKLHDAFQQLRRDVGDPEKPIEDDSIIRQYISTSPPLVASAPDRKLEAWKRVKFVKDFPSFVFLTEERKNGNSTFVYFREPSRTLDGSTIVSELVREGVEIEVFRWKDDEGASKPSEEDADGGC